MKKQLEILHLMFHASPPPQVQKCHSWKWKVFKHRILSFFSTGCYNLRSFERELVKVLDYKTISIFLKHPIHLKWYQFFWNTLYISSDINFSETPYTSQVISIFLKHPIHLKGYQFFWNTLYISSDINFFFKNTLYF